MNQPVLSLPPLPRADLGELRGCQSRGGAVVPHIEGSFGGSNNVSVRNTHIARLCMVKQEMCFTDDLFENLPKHTRTCIHSPISMYLESTGVPRALHRSREYYKEGKKREKKYLNQGYHAIVCI